MTSETILKSDLLDILFDKRNKAYGAYILRKFYPHRIKTSLLIMFAIVILLSAFTFLPDKRGANGKPLMTDSMTTTFTELDKKVEKPKVPKQLLLNIPQQRSNPIPTIVPDTTEIISNANDLPIGSPTIINTQGIGMGDPPPADGDPGDVVTPKPAAPVAISNIPSDNPDIQASFPGGEKELIRFLQKNLRSPRDMEEDEIVEVRIKYVVDFDGNLQGFNVVKDGGEEFNSEVIRVLKKMPRWNPGKKGGQNIPVYYTIPVKFMAN